MPTVIETVSSPWKKARPTSYTTNGYPTRVATNTEPLTAATDPATSQVVHEVGTGGMYCQNGLVVIFFGAGANDSTFSCRVIGWRSIGWEARTTGLWIPVPLAEFAVTLSQAVGVAGMTLVATDRFADTIALTTGNDDVSVDIVSGWTDVIAHVQMDLKGFQKLEFAFTTGGSATSCNALFALL